MGRADVDSGRGKGSRFVHCLCSWMIPIKPPKNVKGYQLGTTFSQPTPIPFNACCAWVLTPPAVPLAIHIYYYTFPVHQYRCTNHCAHPRQDRHELGVIFLVVRATGATIRRILGTRRHERCQRLRRPLFKTRRRRWPRRPTKYDGDWKGHRPHC